MRNLIKLKQLFILCLVIYFLSGCNNSRIVDLDVVYDNGETETIHVETTSNGYVELDGSCIKNSYNKSLVCGVRSFTYCR